MSYLTSAQLTQYEDEGYVLLQLMLCQKMRLLEVRGELEFIEKKWPNELDGSEEETYIPLCLANI